jgi:hypothetical protein
MSAHSRSTSSSNKLQLIHLVLPASKQSHLGSMQLQRQSLLQSSPLSSPVHLRLQLQPLANSSSSSRLCILSKQQQPKLRSYHNNQQGCSKGRHHSSSSSSSRLKLSLVLVNSSSKQQLRSLLGRQRQDQQQQQEEEARQALPLLHTYQALQEQQHQHPQQHLRPHTGLLVPHLPATTTLLTT